MKKKDKILLFGGTFNPIHISHIRIAQEASEMLQFKRIILIPSAIPPHKKDSLSFFHRLKMVKLAIEGIDYIKVSDVESKRDKPSYTIDTVNYFVDKLGKDTSIHWLIGTDTIPELKNWHKSKELLEKCRFIIAERNPYRNYAEDLFIFLRRHITEGIEPLSIGNYFIPLINDVLEISSTDIRDKIAHNKSIRYLVPETVEKYIYDNKLYQNK